LTTDHEKPLKFNTPNEFFSLILYPI
jgi:hypothetical protein